MKRWSNKGEIKKPKIDAFLEAIWAVCERHGMAISHEDVHGGFVIVSIEDSDRDWLMQATDRIKDKP